MILVTEVRENNLNECCIMGRVASLFWFILKGILVCAALIWLWCFWNRFKSYAQSYLLYSETGLQSFASGKQNWGMALSLCSASLICLVGLSSCKRRREKASQSASSLSVWVWPLNDQAIISPIQGSTFAPSSIHSQVPPLARWDLLFPGDMSAERTLK